jgi:acetylornithine aminotransferase
VNAVQPDVVRLAPPLILTEAEAQEFLAALPEILAAASGAATDAAADKEA